MTLSIIVTFKVCVLIVCYAIISLVIGSIIGSIGASILKNFTIKEVALGTLIVAISISIIYALLKYLM